MGHGQAGGGRQRGRTLARRKPCCHGTPALAGAVEAGAGDGTGTCEASSRVGDSTSTEMLLAARGGALHPTAQQPQEGRQSASAAEAEAAATRRRAAACHAENTKICARSSLGSAGCVQLAAGCACQAGTATQGQGHSNRAGHCATQACPACQAHLTSPSMAGMRKAMVLPVPVLARAITSPPASTCAEGESVVGGGQVSGWGKAGRWVGQPSRQHTHRNHCVHACITESLGIGCLACPKAGAGSPGAHACITGLLGGQPAAECSGCSGGRSGGCAECCCWLLRHSPQALWRPGPG